MPGTNWTLTEPAPQITLALTLTNITAAQLETSAIFGYVRFPSDPTDLLAMPALLSDNDASTVDYELVFSGLNGDSVLFTLRTDDRSNIAITDVFSDLEIKFILVPATANANAFDPSHFLE